MRNTLLVLAMALLLGAVADARTLTLGISPPVGEVDRWNAIVTIHIAYNEPGFLNTAEWFIEGPGYLVDPEEEGRHVNRYGFGWKLFPWQPFVYAGVGIWGPESYTTWIDEYGKTRTTDYGQGVSWLVGARVAVNAPASLDLRFDGVNGFAASLGYSF